MRISKTCGKWCAHHHVLESAEDRLGVDSALQFLESGSNSVLLLQQLHSRGAIKDIQSTMGSLTRVRVPVDSLSSHVDAVFVSGSCVCPQSHYHGRKGACEANHNQPVP